MDEETLKFTFENYWDSTRADINTTLEDIFSKEDSMMEQFTFAMRGGKRFRPTLTVLMAEALGGDRHKALEYGAVIEFVHAASLTHDNVQDKHSKRRGNTSEWKEYGIKNALFIGDGLLAKGYSLIKSGEAANCVGKGLLSLFKGFLKEGINPIETLDYLKYLDIIILKTASLYATACELGAISAKGEYERLIKKRKYARSYLQLKEHARRYGKYLGIMYQLADDLGDKELPVFLSDEKAMEEVYSWNIKAAKSLRIFPQTKYRKLLLEVPDFMINKILEEDN